MYYLWIYLWGTGLYVVIELRHYKTFVGVSVMSWEAPHNSSKIQMVEIKCVSRIRNHNREQSNARLCSTHNSSLLAYASHQHPFPQTIVLHALIIVNIAHARRCLHSYGFCAVFLSSRLSLGWRRYLHIILLISQCCWRGCIKAVFDVLGHYNFLLFKTVSFWFVDFTDLPLQCVSCKLLSYLVFNVWTWFKKTKQTKTALQHS